MICGETTDISQLPSILVFICLIFLRFSVKLNFLLHSKNYEGLSFVSFLEHSSEERYKCCGITVRAFIYMDCCQLFALLSTCFLSSLVRGHSTLPSRIEGFLWFGSEIFQIC